MDLRSIFGSATNTLIAINTIVFIAELVYPPIILYGALIPALVLERPRTIITHAFLHANFLHIFFNMFFLWVVGKYLEDIIGKSRFLVIYLLIAASVGLLHTLFVLLLLPQYAWVPSIGASGAVMGVLGLSVVYIGEMTMYVILFPIPIPIRMKVKELALTIFIIETILAIFNIAPGIAHDAHIFGLVLGYVIGKYSTRPRRIRGKKRKSIVTIRWIKGRPRYIWEFYPADIITLINELPILEKAPILIKRLLKNPTDADIREALNLIAIYDTPLAIELSHELESLTVKELAALIIALLLNRTLYLAERGLVKIRERRIG